MYLGGPSGTNGSCKQLPACNGLQESGLQSSIELAYAHAYELPRCECAQSEGGILQLHAHATVLFGTVQGAQHSTDGVQQ